MVNQVSVQAIIIGRETKRTFNKRVERGRHSAAIGYREGLDEPLVFPIDRKTAVMMGLPVFTIDGLRRINPDIIPQVITALQRAPWQREKGKR